MPEEGIATTATPRYKRPESVLVVVYTRMGEVLLMRRTRPANFWQSVTGSLAWGESPRQAARRELFEETGLMAGDRLVDLGQSVRFPILSAWRGRYAPNARSNLEHWFALPLSQRGLIRMNREEHSAYRWLAYPQALRLASSWTNRDAIKALFTQNG
jgi:dATP pyrophosphohydrolase